MGMSEMSGTEKTWAQVFTIQPDPLQVLSGEFEEVQSIVHGSIDQAVEAFKAALGGSYSDEWDLVSWKMNAPPWCIHHEIAPDVWILEVPASPETMATQFRICYGKRKKEAQE